MGLEALSQTDLLETVENMKSSEPMSEPVLPEDPYEARLKERHKQEVKRWISEVIGLTERERTLTFESFIKSAVNQKAFEAAKMLAEKRDKNLFLFGSCGSGKTHLGISVLNVCIDKEVRRLKFAPIAKLLMEVRKTMQIENPAPQWQGGSDTSEEGQIKDLLKNDVLVIDDFGVQKATEWAVGFCDTLIDEWYREGNTGLLITSNFDLDTISRNFSDRIASRIAGMCEVVKVGGDDWRLKKPTTHQEVLPL